MPVCTMQQPAHPNVFISYQRDDHPYAAHLLAYAARAAGLGAFIDTGGIPAGSAFKDVIRETILGTNAVLALMGPRFDPARLHLPGDYVAFEWRTANFLRIPVIPVLLGGFEAPAASELPSELRFVLQTNAYHVGLETLSGDISHLMAALPGLVQVPIRRRRVLWIDDVPTNNQQERRRLRRDLGLGFESVVSTAEAEEAMDDGGYDLIITDCGRSASEDGSDDAGAEFVARHGSKGPPIIIYTSPRMATQVRAQLMALGAFGVTADPVELDTLVRAALGDSAA